MGCTLPSWSAWYVSPFSEEKKKERKKEADRVQPGDPAPSSQGATPSSGSGSSDNSGLGIGLYAVILVGGAIAYYAYQYLQNAEAQQ